MFVEFGEWEWECEIWAALVRESLRERERHVAAGVEAATASAPVLQLHGLWTGGQCRREPQRRTDRDEQQGEVARTAAGLLLLRMTGAARLRRRRQRVNRAYLEPTSSWHLGA